MHCNVQRPVTDTAVGGPTSSRMRCWGSMVAASEGEMPNRAASKVDQSATKPPKLAPRPGALSPSVSQRSRGMHKMWSGLSASW